MKFLTLADLSFDMEDLEPLLFVAKIPKTVFVFSQHEGMTLLLIYCDVSRMMRCAAVAAIKDILSKVVVKDKA